jgi:hypothetical protein
MWRRKFITEYQAEMLAEKMNRISGWDVGWENEQGTTCKRLSPGDVIALVGT